MYKVFIKSKADDQIIFMESRKRLFENDVLVDSERFGKGIYTGKRLYEEYQSTGQLDSNLYDWAEQIEDE